MNDFRSMFADAAEHILTDFAPASRHEASVASDHLGQIDLWRQFDAAGFSLALVAEKSNGSGLLWADAFPLFFAIGQHAASAPITEAMVTHWLAARAGLQLPQGLVIFSADKDICLRSMNGAWTVHGTISRAAWGRYATLIAVICDTPDGQRLVLVDPRAPGASLIEGINLAGEPRDNVGLDGVSVANCALIDVNADALMAIGAVIRSAMMAGALSSALSLAIDYANLRKQFGRQIGKFQAIQHSLAVLASNAAAASAVAEAALECVDAWQAALRTAKNSVLAAQLPMMAAKIRAGEAASLGASIAHQVFGAIGFTQEHELHYFSKRLWSWRDEFGNEAFWSRRLGISLINAGPSACWPSLTIEGSAA